ncbi:MAG: hypothetical protein U5L96_09395 [Owenweeksia sp.]|nr:hypothetical protein [Owenweeksia sp.]
MTNIELDENVIKISYINLDNKEILIQIPINEMTVDYYGNGKGISSLVSDHMRIEQKGKPILKQYKTEGWTLEDLKETTEKLKGLRITNANST